MIHAMMIEYEPLRTLAILTVAAVAAAHWQLRDAISRSLVMHIDGRERLRKTYLRLRGVKDYDGRHRAR